MASYLRNVSFRGQSTRSFSHSGLLRRTFGDTRNAGTSSANEHTSLLSPLPPPWDEREGNWRQIFFNPEWTPGMRSANALIRLPAGMWHAAKVTLFSNVYINMWLLFVPFGLVAGSLQWSPAAVFVLNGVGMMPLFGVMAFALDEFALCLGDTLGGLATAILGGTGYLTIWVVAIMHGQVRIAQSSIIGSILSSLLLRMGLCFFVGGIFNMRSQSTGEGLEQAFATSLAQTTTLHMILSSLLILAPSLLRPEQSNDEKHSSGEAMLTLSCLAAAVLLCLNIVYLYFQLRTHRNVYYEDRVDSDQEDLELGEMLGLGGGVVVFLFTTSILALSAHYMIDAIEEFSQNSGIHKQCIGFVLIPIVMGGAETITAVVVAARNKMDIALGIVIGSSLQTALFEAPLMVIGSTILHLPLTLDFTPSEIVSLLLAVLAAAYSIQCGKSRYVDGAMFLGLYIVTVTASFVDPGQSPAIIQD